MYKALRGWYNVKLHISDDSNAPLCSITEQLDDNCSAVMNSCAYIDGNNDYSNAPLFSITEQLDDDNESETEALVKEIDR